MSDNDLTDADVLAELREGVAGVDEDGIERYAWTHPEGISPAGVTVLVRLLALSRREAREAAAVERERVATAMLEHAAVLRERRGMHTNGPADTCRHQIADAFGNYARNVLRGRGQS